MSIRYQNFFPSQNYTMATTTASAVSQAVVQPSAVGGAGGGYPLLALRIANNANGVAFVRINGGAATTTGANDIPILAGEDVIFDTVTPSTSISAILASGTGNVYIGLGEGS